MALAFVPLGQGAVLYGYNFNISRFHVYIAGKVLGLSVKVFNVNLSIYGGRQFVSRAVVGRIKFHLLWKYDPRPAVLQRAQANRFDGFNLAHIYNGFQVVALVGLPVSEPPVCSSP